MNWIKIRDYFIGSLISISLWKLGSFELSVCTLTGMILGELIYNNESKNKCK